MLNSYYTLNVVASSLHSRIRGWRISGLFTQAKDELVISFDGRPESLLICCRPEVHTLYLHPSFSRAKKNSTGVLQAAAGKRVTSVSIVPGNRIVLLTLEEEYSLAALLYGPHANVALTDNSGIMVDSFKRGHPPSVQDLSQKPDNLIFDEVLLRETPANMPTLTLAAAVRKAIPTFGGTLAREAATRAGLSATMTCSELLPHQTEMLLSGIRDMLRDLFSPVPRLYTRGHGPPVLFSLIPLQLAKGLTEEAYGDVHEAIRTMVQRGRSAALLDEKKNRTVALLRQRVLKARRALGAMEDPTVSAARAIAYERSGSWLLAHLPAVEKGSSSIHGQSDGEEVVIPLDVRLTPGRNAQRFFEKAKRTRTALQEARVRRADLEGLVAAGEELLALLEQVQSKEMLKEFMDDHETELKRFGIGPSGNPSAQVPFRVFTVDGGFEVWAGKSSTNNDLLTFRHAKPNDLWFHARGSSGSHVVLKTGSGRGEPGKRAKEQAASIAAYYSKMRHAKMVPVAMTERKYVRKPKGSPPGTVVLEREKVIFAEPGLPEGTRKEKQKEE